MTTRILDFFGLERSKAERLLRFASQVITVLAMTGVLLVIAARNPSGPSGAARRSATLATLSVVQNALQQYRLTYSAYPPDLYTLVSVKILEPSKLTDGWKRPLLYQPVSFLPDQPF